MAEPAPQFSMGNILRAQQALLAGGSGGAPAAEQAPPAAASDSPEALHYLRVARRWWMWSALAAAIVVAATLVSECLRTPTYVATSGILLTQSVVGRGLSDEISNTRVFMSASAVAKLLELPSTRSKVARRLVDWSMGKESAVEVMPKLSGGGSAPPPGWFESSEFLESLRGSLAAKSDSEDVEVSIVTSFRGNSKVAVAMANAAAYSLVEDFNERRAERSGIEPVGKAREQTLQELGELDREISRLHRERIAKSAEGLPVDISERLSMLRDTERELDLVGTETLEMERTLEGLEQSTMGKVAVDPAPPHLVARLIDMELELEDYKKRYTDEHPKMTKLKEEITALNQAIERYRGRMASGGTWSIDVMTIEIIRARSKLAGLNARSQRLKDRRVELAKSLARDDYAVESSELEAKLRERRVAEDLALTLGGQLMRAKIAEADLSSNAEGRMTVNPARSARNTGSRTITLVIGLLVALAAAAATAFLLEHLDVTVRSPMDVRAVAGLTTVGVVPLFGDDEFILPDQPRSRCAEAFSVLRNAVRYASRNQPEKCLVVTSSTPREGKSYVSANLAVSFAQEGNTVVLVNADMRKGGEHLLTQVSAPAAASQDVGLVSYLEGQASFDDVVIPTTLQNLWIVPSGGVAANPASSLRSARMTELLGELQKRFDIVIIDTPPVLPVVDATLVSPSARGVLLVAHAGTTRSGEFSEAVSRLRHVNAPLVGVALNRATPASTGYEYAGYHSYSEYSA